MTPARARGSIGTCGAVMTRLVDDSVLHLRARGWPAAAVQVATAIPVLRRVRLVHGADVRRWIEERRARDAARRDTGRWAPVDPIPDALWRALLEDLDDRTAFALVVVGNARHRVDPEVMSWLATTRVDERARRRERRALRRPSHLFGVPNPPPTTGAPE